MDTMKYRMKDKQVRNEKLYEYYLAGYTYRAIAGIFHISHTMVGKIVNRLKKKGGDS